MDSYQRPKWPRAYAASPPEPIGRIDIWTYQLSQLVSQLSFLYELALTWLHSFAKWIFFDLLRIDELFRRTPRKVTHPWEEFVATHSTTVVDPTPSGASQRAWWDNSNGSAIVIYGGSSQDLVTSLAISLASCKSQSRRNEARAQASSRHRPERPTSSGNSEWLAWIRSTASQLLSRDHSYRGGGSARSGRAPFTVIVLVPRAEDLSQLIHAWASSKALLDRHRAPSPPESTIDGTQTPLSPKTPPTSLSPPSRSRPSSPTASSSNASGTFRSRSRALSWGQWAAHSGLVGFRDLWKGVRIGEESTRNEFGAVIPIVCDESSSEHSDHARDTVMSYCNSHDLLLRGLIVIPDKASDEHQLTLRHLSALLEHDRGRLITIETASHRTNPTPSFGQDISRSSVIIDEFQMSRTRVGPALGTIWTCFARCHFFSAFLALVRFWLLVFSVLLFPPIIGYEDPRLAEREGPQHVSPFMLFSIRSALSRSHLRKYYCIGFGPRVQTWLFFLPFAKSIFS